MGLFSFYSHRHALKGLKRLRTLRSVLSREKQDATLNLNNTRSSSEQAKCSGFDISKVTCIHHKSMGV